MSDASHNRDLDCPVSLLLHMAVLFHKLNVLGPSMLSHFT